MTTFLKITINLLFMIQIFCVTTFAQNRWVSFAPSATSAASYLAVKRAVSAPGSDLPTMEVTDKGESGFEINYLFPGGEVSEASVDDVLYQLLHIDQFAKLNDPGKPALPARQYTIAVPNGKNARIEMYDAVSMMFSGYTVQPALEPASDFVGAPEPVLYKDEEVYGSEQAYPSQAVSIVSEKIYRGQKLITVQICPVQALPLSNEIIVYSKIHFEVVFEDNGTELVEQPALSGLQASLLNNVAINAQSIPGVLEAIGHTEQRGKILIVTTDAYKDAADTLSLWKRMMGYTVEIISKPSWANSTEVQDSIHSRYKGSAEPIDFCAIIGDNPDVPSYFSTLGSYDHVTDLYFASMDGVGDFTPDIAIGRISVSNPTEALMVVNKIVTYERNPVTKTDFYRHGVTAAYFQHQGSGYAQRRFAQTSWEIRQYLTGEFGYDIDREFVTGSSVNPTYWNNGYYSSGEPIPSYLQKPNYAWDATAGSISADINDGRFMVFHRDHGDVTLWGDPYYTTSDVSALTNGDELPVVFSINCLTGKFNVSGVSFAEAFMRNTNGGAVGVIAATEISYSGQNDGFAEGLVDAIWPDPGLVPSFPHNSTPTVTPHEPVYHMGYVLNQGKMRMSETWNSGSSPFGFEQYSYELFHWHGDPSMMMWTDVPADIAANVPTALMIGQPSYTLTGITATKGVATILFENEVLGRCEIDSIGTCEIIFDTPAMTTGIATVSITGHNYRPLITSINVIPPGDAMFPSAPSAGQLYDVGETVSITWATYGIIPMVTIEMSIDSFATTLFSTTEVNIDRYDWIAPSISSNSVQVRISDVDGDPTGITHSFTIQELSTISGGILDSLPAIIEYVGPQSGSIDTDSSGQFALTQLLPGTYTLRAVAGVYSSDTITVTVPGDTSGIIFTVNFPNIVATPDSLFAELNSGDFDTLTVTLTNSGTTDLTYAMAGLSGSSIIINEVSSSPDYIEIWNRGSDLDLTGWSLHWDDNTATAGSYSFVSGFVITEDRKLIFSETSGTSNDSIIFFGSNLGWVTSSQVAVWLVNPEGDAVDFMKTLNTLTATPAGTEWFGPGVDFSQVNASRNSNEDADTLTDWTNLSSGTQHRLNVGQTDEVVIASWLEILDTLDGVIAAGSSIDVQVQFNAIGLVGGIYTDTLEIENNSLNNPLLSLQIMMRVHGVKKLNATVANIDFGSVLIGSSASATITFINEGSEATLIDSINSLDPRFSVNAFLPLVVPVFDSITVQVLFNPTTIGSATDVFTVLSDASDNPVIDITASGIGLEAPLLDVDPLEIVETVASGDSAIVPLLLRNIGGSIMNAHLSAGDLGSTEGSDTIDILIYTYGADMSGEYLNVIEAIDNYIPNYTVTHSVAIDSITLRNELVGKDAFIFMEQESGVPVGLGHALGAEIQNFMELGGNVVVQSPTNNTNTIAFTRDAGIMDISEVSQSTSGWGAVVDSTHTLFDSIATGPFEIITATTVFSINDASVSLVDGGAYGNSIVAEKIHGRGRAVVMGPDFFYMRHNWMKLYCNAITNGKISPHWLSFNKEDVSIAVGDSSFVNVTLHGAHLIAGTYSAAVNVTYGVPGVGHVPVTFTVTAENVLHPSVDSMYFPTTPIGESSNYSVTLTNAGNSATTVDSILSSKNVFVLDATVFPIDVPAFSSITLSVMYAPVAVGSDYGIITVFSDAMNSSEINIAAQGAAVELSSISGGILDSLPAVIEYAGPQSGSIDTDSSGQFILANLFPGTYILKAIAGVHASDTVSVTVPGDTSGIIFTINYPNFEIAPDSLIVDLNSGDLDTMTVTFTNSGTSDLTYTMGGLSGSSIIINEVSSNPDYIEIWNRGSDLDLTGWSLHWDDNTATAGSYSFVSGFVITEDRKLIFSETSGISNDSTIFFGRNLGWVTSSQVAVWLVNPEGDAVDFMKTLNTLTSTPVGTEWFGPGVDFSQVNASRNGNEDTDTLSDWTTLSSGTQHRLNAGQTDEVVIASWLEILDTLDGVIAAGSSIGVQVQFNTIGLAGGQYVDTLVIENNSLNNPVFSFPISMRVHGVKKLSTTISDIDFGLVEVGSSATATVSFINDGAEATIIDSISIIDPHFVVNTVFPLTVSAFDSVSVHVSFIPTAIGTITDTMTIISDASDNPVITIDLSGSAVLGPLMSVDPDSMVFNLTSSQSPQDLLGSITNSGDAELTYSIKSIKSISAPAVAVESRGFEVNTTIQEQNDMFAHEHVAGELIVGFHTGTSEFSEFSTLNVAGMSISQDLSVSLKSAEHIETTQLRKVVLLRATGDAGDLDLYQARESLLRDPSVAFVDANFIYRASVVPNDIDMHKLFGMDNYGQTGGTIDADIDAVEAWDIHTGSGNVVLGVIDTGIDYLHPDLIDNVWTNPGEIAGNGIDDDGNGYIDDIHGWDFHNNDNDPIDDNNHGTHCSGTIGGTGNNGVGVAGVTWDVQIAGLKFLDGRGSGSLSNAVLAINYATAMGFKITSNSWGGGGYSQAMKDAIELGGAHGNIFIAAAGNDNRNTDSSPAYPASYDSESIISVAATDHNDARSSFSNYGSVTVDLGAPGSAIYSTVRGGSYDTFNGTSMATPHVAGAAALVLSYNESLTGPELKEILLTSVDSISSMTGITTTNGRLNVFNALNSAGSPWLSAAIDSIPVVGAGDIDSITVTANPDGLIAGTYVSEIVIQGDDLSNPEETIVVTAHVAACRELVPSVDSLDFGLINALQVATRTVTLTNACNGPVTVSSISGVVNGFGVVEDSLIVPAFGSYDLVLTFADTVIGFQSEIMTLVSDADGTSIIDIVLQGEVVMAPDLAVNLSTIDETAAPGESVSVPFTLSNIGGGILNAELSVENLGFSEASETAEVLIWTVSADMGGEYLNVVNAINANMSKVTITNSAATDSLGLEAALAGKTTFVIMEQEGGIPAGVGAGLGPVMNEFVSNGGVIIVHAPGWNTGSSQFIAESGLMDITYQGYATSGTISILDSMHAIFDGVTPPMTMPNASSYFQVNDGSNILATYSGYPVIAERIVDKGYIYLMAPDYFDVSSNWARVLTNTIQIGEATPRWISLDTTIASITAGDTAVITASLSAAELVPGVYTADIRINHDGISGSAIIPVTFEVTDEVQPPKIQVSITQISDSLVVPDSTTGTMVLYNSGGDTLEWNFDTTSVMKASWFAISAEQGSLTPGDSIELTYTLYSRGLSDGSYLEMLTILSNDIANAIIDISVSLTVESVVLGPILQLSIDSLYVNADIDSQVTEVFYLFNSGDEELVLSMIIDGDTVGTNQWLSLNTYAEVIAPGDSLFVSALFDAAGQTAGLHGAVIRIETNSLVTPIDSVIAQLFVNAATKRYILKEARVGIPSIPYTSGVFFKMRDVHMGHVAGRAQGNRYKISFE